MGAGSEPQSGADGRAAGDRPSGGASAEDGFGSMTPQMAEPPPGPRSTEMAARLRAVESRNVTHLSADFPVFWEEARGANVRDVDGNVYVDLTGAFGVALTGHSDPRILEAARRQSARLSHGMGDVHPPAVKLELLERLDAVLPWPDSRTVLATSGAEAIEVALKTALLATGRPGVLSFEGGYHGLTLGALAATDRSDFREPFESRLYAGVARLPFPLAAVDGGPARPSLPHEDVLARVEETLSRGAPNGDLIGAVVVEPIQGRAGVLIPPDGFLAALGDLAHDAGALVVADEIFTGLGRTGVLFEAAREGLEPDLVCLGKALGGGYPLSACAGSASVMDAWPESRGEAIHTSTFLGHPISCAASIAFLDVLERDDVPARASALGGRLLASLREELDGVGAVVEIRGRGLMIGIEVEPGCGAEVAARALADGVLVLPAGAAGEVVQLTPPVVLTERQASAAVEVLGRAIRASLA